MEIFITELFIDALDRNRKNAFESYLAREIITLDKIQNLVLSGLPIHCDMSASEIKEHFDDSGIKNYKNFKEIFSQTAIKSGKYYSEQLSNIKEIPNYKAYYFFEITENLFGKSGAIIVHDFLDTNNFFENCTVNSRDISSDYSIIENAVPPCNALLYIDKYLFSHKDKVNNFIKFLNLYKKRDLEIPFQLSILSSYENNNKTIPASNFKYAENELNGIKNLQFEILLDNKIPKDDRLIFTNYTKGSIGHPFDDRPTIFNQNFLGTSNDIKKTYEDYIENLSEWSNFISKMSDNSGLIQTKYSNASFKNRLLQDI